MLIAMSYKLIHLFLNGTAIARILEEIIHRKSFATPIDYVLCIGHFLEKVMIELTTSCVLATPI